jgi:hypothetical protein
VSIDSTIAQWCASSRPSRQMDADALEAARRGLAAGDPRNAQHVLYGLFERAWPLLKAKIEHNTIFQDYRKQWPHYAGRLGQEDGPIPEPDIEDAAQELLMAGERRFRRVNLPTDTPIDSSTNPTRWCPETTGVSLLTWFINDCLFNLPNIMAKLRTQVQESRQLVLRSDELLGQIDSRAATDPERWLTDERAFKERRDTLPSHLHRIANLLPDYSQAEIARQLGMKPSTVSGHVKQLKGQPAIQRGAPFPKAPSEPTIDPKENGDV